MSNSTASPNPPVDVTVAVGSRNDQICSVGAFARAEFAALEGSRLFRRVRFIEPNSKGEYPRVRTEAQSGSSSTSPFILYHSPSLYDRVRPWNCLLALWRLRRCAPGGSIISVVHEYCEAPLHWKIRQLLMACLSDGVIVNTHPEMKILSRWIRKIIRIPLGPTLFREDLLNHPHLADELIRTRLRAAKTTGLNASKRWIVHPGLLTPGKGLDQLIRVATALQPSDLLIVMGGLGPKLKDKAFANQILSELQQKISVEVVFLNGLSDAPFRDVLTGCDLVVLPYDSGVSERRSSFLSAMSCGSLVWATTGALSVPMNIETSGVATCDAQNWRESATAGLEQIRQILDEPLDARLERRRKNLDWSAERSWKRRVDKIFGFFGEL